VPIKAIGAQEAEEEAREVLTALAVMAGLAGQLPAQETVAAEVAAAEVPGQRAFRERRLPVSVIYFRFQIKEQYMKLMFHKQELYGHWFRDNEDSTGYTDKIPPDAAHEWDEELNEWVLPEVEEEVEYEEPETEQEG